MKLKQCSQIKLPPTADFHVHLRQDSMMELVTPFVEHGGCDTVFVMPNLQPPLTKVSDVVEYHNKLTNLAPSVKFMMSLYLSPDVTVETIEEAARAKIIYGVKLYPAGVTTNSQDGVLDIEPYFPVFEAMQEHDIVLNLHGEMSSSHPSSFEITGEKNITVLNAEPKFLPQLFKLHHKFPSLRIVLEHVSTRAGLDAVQKCGPNVSGTITAHHLLLTIDNWVGDVFSYCKPVAKTPEDRIALIRAIIDNPQGKFFFGSDSAPHPIESKKGLNSHMTAAGCFTQPWCTPLVLSAVEEAIEYGWISEDDVSLDKIEGFLSKFGRAFYKIHDPPLVEGDEADARYLILERKGQKIPPVIRSNDGKIELVPFGRGREVMSLSWRRGRLVAKLAN